MVDFNTIENILMALTLIFLILYGIATMGQTRPKWFLSKTYLKTRAMQQNYDKLLQSRKDMLHHYYWSKSNDDKTHMKKQQKQIIRIDKQLKQMRSEYEIVRKGLPVPLKMF